MALSLAVLSCVIFTPSEVINKLVLRYASGDDRTAMAKEASPWQLRHSDLESFVVAHLRQKETFLEELQRALHRVVTHITNHASYTLSRVVVSGDLAGGTSALNEDSEFQLLLFISDFRSIDDYHKRIQGVLTQTRDLLDSEEVMHLVMLRGKDCVINGAILVRVMVGDEWFEGQMALAVDLIGSNPSTSNKETMYRQFMQDKDKLPFQPTLSDLRRNLIQSLPTPVKDVILLVKFWRKHRLRLRSDKPTAWFYELLVIHCWEMAGSPEIFNLAIALMGVLTALSNWKEIHIVWEDSKSRGYPRKIAEGKLREILASDYEGPVTLDPIDPRLEYCACVKTLVWDEISRTAREALMEPLFQELNDCCKWQN